MTTEQLFKDFISLSQAAEIKIHIFWFYELMITQRNSIQITNNNSFLCFKFALV